MEDHMEFLEYLPMPPDGPPPHPVNNCIDPDCDCGFDPDTAPGGHDDY